MILHDIKRYLGLCVKRQITDNSVAGISGKEGPRTIDAAATIVQDWIMREFLQAPLPVMDSSFIG